MQRKWLTWNHPEGQGHSLGQFPTFLMCDDDTTAATTVREVVLLYTHHLTES